MSETVHPLSKVLAALGWSQGDLSARAKVAQSTISFALNGKRSGKFSAEAATRILACVAGARAAGRTKVPRLTLSDLVFPAAGRRCT